MPAAPAISVLLPVYNGVACVRRAIESIRGQTARDWELVVVDDGSTDGTGAELRRAAAVEPRLRIIPQPHRGLVAALNAGLAAARGRLIARMDADDLAHPDRLAEQAALLAARPDLGLAGCLVNFGGDASAHRGYALHVAWINSLVTPEEIALNRFVESPLAHPSVLFRRELVTRHGGYRAGNFPEDYELWLRWLEAGVRVAKVPRVLLTWSDSPGRLSRTERRYDAEAFFRIKAPYLARWLHRQAGEGAAPAGARAGGARRLLVWGAGRPTRKRAAHLRAEGVGIDGYIDIDPRKATAALGGRGAPVIPPAELPGPAGSFVLGYVGTRGARELVRAELTRRGYAEGRDFLMCA